MRKQHEQLLFRYSSALERGDFESVAAVLREAERDPELEAMILELNVVYAAEPSERFNHKNAKEMMGMIAPLYQKRTPAPPRPYNLPMIAALAIVALIVVLLVTWIAPSTNWNTGQDGSPEAIAMQGTPDECAPNEADPGRIQLYTRPAEGAAYAYGAYSLLYVAQSSFSVLEWVEADGETWYFVRIHDVFDEDLQGWMKETEYVRNVRCASLMNAGIMTEIAASMALTGTPTVFDGGLSMTATALIAEASAMPPTVVPDGSVFVFEGMNCPAVTNHVVNVSLEASNAARVVTQLPAGMEVEVFMLVEQVDGTWYYINYRTLLETNMSGFVAPGSLTLSEDCAITIAPIEALTATPVPTEVPGAVLILPPTVVSPDSIQTQDALLKASQPSCTGVSKDVLSIYTAPLRQSRVIIEAPIDSVVDVSAYNDQPDGRWYVVGYWAAAGVYITGLVAPDTLSLSEACADVRSVVTYTPTPAPSLPPRQTATPTPAQ